MRAVLIGLALLLAAGTAAFAAERAADLTLTGAMTGQDHQTYREVPFRVPAGVTRLTVRFEHTGQDQRSVIDVGLRDPARFRGWSGGDKAEVTISESEATPAYLPGPIPAGPWTLILGVPNLRKGAEARYTARIFFERGTAFGGFYDAPLKTTPGWYRGDLHLHTGHSDASCASRRGAKVPCPLYKTVEAAEARGLDFIAITDHNTTSHDQAMRELAPYFDDLLLIPGREITTFQGHANVFGPEAFIDFQLGSPRAPDMASILSEVEKAGGLISINHPGLPSGETCMGCGWTAKVDFGRIPMIEAENGGALRQSQGGDFLSGLAFWEARLNAGYRITGVGGSDNHNALMDPAEAASVGSPTTVVHAPELSQPAILSALRAGHVFVDLKGTRDRLLEVTAEAGGHSAEMGDALSAPVGAALAVHVHVAHAAGGHLAFAGTGPLPKLADAELTSADETRSYSFAGDGRPHWIRIDVRGPDGNLWLLGNPIYLNPAARTAR
ncbi:MAG: PHP domain-containing protein [Phenylobacterium sp.]|nr:MAG: PHP domain-containing protein [Phenylobacterium sp.]